MVTLTNVASTTSVFTHSLNFSASFSSSQFLPLLLSSSRHPSCSLRLSTSSGGFKGIEHKINRVTNSCKGIHDICDVSKGMWVTINPPSKMWTYGRALTEVLMGDGASQIVNLTVGPHLPCGGMVCSSLSIESVE